jgi:bifunctional non-homologous end joining protein LigD
MPFQPLPLTRRPDPLSHPDWIFEIEYDGFRSLAFVDGSGTRLISRHGNRFASFDSLCQSVVFFLSVKSAVIDGEIACLDENGCSQFNHLLFRKGEPTFCAFDLLSLNGRDLRDLPLIERKRRLRDTLPECPQLLFVDHIQERGSELFDLACKRDLEGIVAKQRQSRYTVENGNPAWIKIRNRNYSQMIGRDDLFERRYEAKGAPEIGWNVCAKAAGSAA